MIGDCSARIVGNWWTGQGRSRDDSLGFFLVVRNGICVSEDMRLCKGKRCLEFLEILASALFYLDLFQDFEIHIFPVLPLIPFQFIHIRVFYIIFIEKKSYTTLTKFYSLVSITKRPLNLPNSLLINPCFLSTFTRFNTLLF